MKLRTVIFWPHLVAGVLGGVVILVMSVTGALLTYERQMVEWSNRDLESIPAAGASRMPVEAVLAGFAAARPDVTPTGVAVGSAAADPVIVSAGQRSYYVDAYSGRVLGEGHQGMRQFMSQVKAWHRWLAVEGEGRPTARAFTGWSNVLFLFIVSSGLYLWFPRQWTWKHLKPVFLFSSGLRGKARDFNWHNVIGVWSMVPLFVVVACAVPISFPWGNDLVYRAVGEQPPAGRRGGGAEGGQRVAGRGEGRGSRSDGPRAEGRGSEGPRREGGSQGGDRADRPSFDGLNALVAKAQSTEPEWQTITVRLPESARAPIALAIDRGNGGQPQLRSTLTLARTGEVVGYETFTTQSLGRRIRTVMRFAHTGEVLGLPGQTVAGIASAGGGVLVWTGLALALRRLRAWVARRRALRERAGVPTTSAA